MGAVAYHPDPKNLNFSVAKRVPFFLNNETTSINKTIDNELYERIENLNTLNFTLIRNSGGFDCIPDGAYNISLLNDTHLKFDIKVKDVR